VAVASVAIPSVAVASAAAEVLVGAAAAVVLVAAGAGGVAVEAASPQALSSIAAPASNDNKVIVRLRLIIDLSSWLIRFRISDCGFRILP
jgi:hypothetical protein